MNLKQAPILTLRENSRSEKRVLIWAVKWESNPFAFRISVLPKVFSSYKNSLYKY